MWTQISKEKGFALTPGTDFPPMLYTDPGSQKIVLYDQINVNFGLNAGANLIDFGLYGGYSGTKMIFNLPIPFWPEWLKE